MTEPTKDDELGMAWWNNLTEHERTKWAYLAGTGRVKDAWEVFKISARREALTNDGA